MTEITLKVKYYNQFSELVEIIENIEDLFQQRMLQDGSTIMVFNDPTKEFTIGSTEDCDIQSSVLFGENEKFTIKNNGYMIAILNQNGMTTPNNYYQMVSNSFNMEVLRRTTPDGRLEIPALTLKLLGTPVGLFLFLEGNGMNIDNDYYHRIAVELLRSAFLVHQNEMEMNI